MARSKRQGAGARMGGLVFAIAPILLAQPAIPDNAKSGGTAASAPAFRSPAATTAVANAAPSVGQDAALMPDETSVEVARRLRKEGLELHEKHDFEGARAKYLAAFRRMKTYALAANLGAVEVALHRYRDAAEHLAFALRESPKDKAPEARVRVTANYEEAKQHVALLSIAVDVDEAAIVVNGSTVGRSPLLDPVFVEPGSVKVQAQAGNRVSEVSTADVAAGTSREIRLALRDPVPIVAVAASSAAGRNALPALGPTDRSTTKGDSFYRNSMDSRGPELAPVLVGAGLTMVGVVLGVAFGAIASSKAGLRDERRATLQGQNPCAPDGPSAYRSDCSSLQSLENDWRVANQISVAGYVGAGIAAAATLGHVLLNWPKAKAQTGVAPVIGPGHGELMFRTAF